MQEEFEKKLEELVPKFYEINEVAKSSKKESDSYKEEIKNIFEELTCGYLRRIQWNHILCRPWHKSLCRIFFCTRKYRHRKHCCLH